MTCIAAVTDGTTVWMGADSAGVSGWDLTVRRDPKVFLRDEYLFGFTSSFRMGQLLYHCDALPPRFYSNENPGDLHGFMVRKFVPWLRDCFKAGGFAVKDKEQESGGTFLVGFRGRLFQVEADYQVGESLDSFDAVGCGAAYAKGALFATSPAITPGHRIQLALEAAERHSAGVRGPYTILSTMGGIAP